MATNTSALKLYKKLGFIQLGKIPNGFLLKNGKYDDIYKKIKEGDFVLFEDGRKTRVKLQKATSNL